MEGSHRMTAPSLFDLPPSTTIPASEPPPPASLDAPVPAPSIPDAGVAQTLALYRKYRPQTFGEDDLVGQEHVV